MKTKKFSIRVLAEIAIFAAIAYVLDLFQGIWFKGIWPNGGSIGIAMVPIFVISYRRGLLPGLICGLIVGVVQMSGGVYAVTGKNFDNAFMQTMAPFIQISLDYVLAYFLVGFAGAFARLYAKGKDFKTKVIWIIVGTLVGGGLKFLAHFAAGYFWLNTSDSFYGIASDSMLFSFVYNGTYSFPNIILCTLIMVVLAKIAPFLLDVNYKKEVETLEEEKENEVEQA